MQKIFLPLIPLFLAAALCACEKTTPETTISHAELAINSGDINQARSVEALAADTATTLLPSQLCRIALVYMHLAENDKQHYDDDVAMATQCFLRALQQNPDSVAAFYKAMPVNELPAMNTLNELASAITSPVDISENPADTIPEPSHSHDNE